MTKPGHQTRILDLGCGRAKREGSIGLDLTRETSADVVADMDNAHLPFKDMTFDEIVIRDSLEHVSDVRATLKEAARILRHGGFISVRVPHFSSLHAYSDFTHRNFFSAEGLRTLFNDDPGYGHYTIPYLDLAGLHITLWRAWRLLGVEWFANRYTLIYEKLFAFRFPAMSMEFRLTLKKKSVKN